jgi:nicotinamide-nucleotide amidase
MPGDIPQIVSKVHDLLKGRGLTLAVAESCTGGLICHYLTEQPGASAFFVAGVVSYVKEMKERILGVSPETIEIYGVVSGETAREMAEKTRVLAGTDYSLSSTGNLGPDVLEGKERGLVYVGACSRTKTFTRELHLKGDRACNKKEGALKALEFLVEVVEQDEMLDT